MCVWVCVCAGECVFVRVKIHAWLYACDIYTTCTTSISLAMHLCILRLVSVNKHIWVPVCLVCVCLSVFFLFCLKPSVWPSGITSQGSYQTWVIRGVWVTLLHLCNDAAESITDKVVFLHFYLSLQCLLPPLLPPQQSNGIAWRWDKISIAPTHILLHLLICLPAVYCQISIVCEHKTINGVALIPF